jgi:hypothetical protein
MNDNDKTPKDTETILMALDQISQTIDVMTSVVGRLRTYLQEHNTGTVGTDTKQGMPEETQSDRVLH